MDDSLFSVSYAADYGIHRLPPVRACPVVNWALGSALAPAYQARRIARQVMPEVALAAEVLTVWVLSPSRDGVFVTERSSTATRPSTAWAMPGGR